MEISKFTRHDLPTGSSWLMPMHIPPGAISRVWTATGSAPVKVRVACTRNAILGVSLVSAVISWPSANLAHYIGTKKQLNRLSLLHRRHGQRMSVKER